MAAGIYKSLEEYLSLYKSLINATEEQLKSLENDNMKAFGEAFEIRQLIQEKIEIAGDLDELNMEEIKNNKGMLKILEEIAESAQKVKNIDKLMLEMVSEKRETIARELDRLKAGRKGVKGYGKAEAPLPKFVDREG